MSTHNYGEISEKFAEITSTDTALAMFFLQDVDWNLESALNNYYNSSPARTPLKVISWNIQGLESRSIERRIRHISETIQNEPFDVVLLQEVVPLSLGMLRDLLGRDFHFHCQSPGQYFTATLVRKGSARVEDAQEEFFEGSRMGRGLLKTRISVGGRTVMVINAHLESCREFSKERKAQLRRSFAVMGGHADSIFGGDLNLSDGELKAVGGVPGGAVDVWEATGRRPEVEFTWDTTRNHNLGCSFASRKRMDRLYLRSEVIRPAYFGLEGIRTVPSTQLFPSDHWAIVAHFCL